VAAATPLLQALYALSMQPTSTTDIAWMIAGAVALAIVSSLLFTVGVMNPFVPMPLHMVMLAWMLSYGFIFVLPAIYLIQFRALSNRKNFGKVILYTALLLSVFSIFYFWNSWEYGLKYQGESHTKIVAVENLVGLISLVLLAYLGISRESKVLQLSANLYLFLLLAWCIFPYLGEMP
jgi:hypothetical protein